MASFADEHVLLPCPYCKETLTRARLTAKLDKSRISLNNGYAAYATVDIHVDVEALKLHIIEEHS